MQFKEHMKRRLIFGQYVLRDAHCACRVDGNSPHTPSASVVNLVDSRVISSGFLCSVMHSACSKTINAICYKNCDLIKNKILMSDFETVSQCLFKTCCSVQIIW